MVDTSSILFSFTRVDNFYELMIDREDITTNLFDGVTKNFKIVLVEECENNARDNINADGTLNTDVVTVINGEDEGDGECALLWSVGVNTNRTISIADSSVTYDLGDNSYLLKGAFLVVANSGVVLSYSINNAPIPISSSFTAPVDGMIWSIRNQVYEG